MKNEAGIKKIARFPKGPRKISMHTSSKVLLFSAFLAAGSVLTQIAQAQQGEFLDETPAITNPGYNLKSLQEAWKGNKPNTGIGQPTDAPGYRQLTFSWKKIHYLRLRFGTISIIRLDPNEKIDSVVIGDRSAFEIVLLGKFPNLVQVHPTLVGVDSNMSIITKDGRIYSLFLASHPNDYPKTTDIIIDILLGEDIQHDRPSYRALGPHPDVKDENQSLGIQTPSIQEITGLPINNRVIQEGIISISGNNTQNSNIPENTNTNTPLENLQDQLGQFGLGPKGEGIATSRPGSETEILDLGKSGRTQNRYRQSKI